MQIVPFLTHYQLVYANFYFSSFSLISYVANAALLQRKRAALARPKHGLWNAEGRRRVGQTRTTGRRNYASAVCFSTSSATSHSSLYHASPKRRFKGPAKNL